MPVETGREALTHERVGLAEVIPMRALLMTMTTVQASIAPARLKRRQRLQQRRPAQLAPPSQRPHRLTW